MEPTGMAWFPVASWLRAAGVQVIRVKGASCKIHEQLQARLRKHEASP